MVAVILEVNQTKLRRFIVTPFNLITCNVKGFTPTAQKDIKSMAEFLGPVMLS